MYLNYCQITIVLVVDPLSSKDYLMMTHCLVFVYNVASNLAIKLWLLGNYQRIVVLVPRSPWLQLCVTCYKDIIHVH